MTQSTAQSPWRRHVYVLAALLLATGVMLLVERAGVQVASPWRLHGDIRRESRVFEQFGQVASAIIIALLIWQLDPPRRKSIPVMALALLATGGVANLLKHEVGRARPATDSTGAAIVVADGIDEGSHYQSFPSGHAAAAAATAVILSALYPRGGIMFWGFAIATATLRYVTNAHWPSDVLAGLAIGYSVAHLVWHFAIKRRETMPSGILKIESRGTMSASKFTAARL